MKTLHKSLSVSPLNIIYHRLHPVGTQHEIVPGSVGATMMERIQSQEDWENINKQMGDGMAEVRAAVLEPLSKESQQGIAPHAWGHKRR